MTVDNERTADLREGRSGTEATAHGMLINIKSALHTQLLRTLCSDSAKMSLLLCVDGGQLLSVSIAAYADSRQWLKLTLLLPSTVVANLSRGMPLFMRCVLCIYVISVQCRCYCCCCSCHSCCCFHLKVTSSSLAYLSSSAHSFSLLL